jgi:NAD(P)-dependent dehydrogenase (short-subunit alcohol dehydrogenase family)
VQQLEGRTAVISGGAGGIGLGLARRLAEAGANVVLADIDETALDEAQHGLRAAGATVEGIVTDVADADATDLLASKARARFGSVELLFCNAGVAGGSKGSLWETPPAEWQRVLGINTLGVTNLLRAFVPDMLGGEEGHIVITSSMAAFGRAPVAAPYFASKHAALSIGQSLRLQLQAIGSPIGVSVLCPSAVSTGILAREVAHQRRTGGEITPEEEATWLSRLAETTPGVLTPDEVAQTVLDGIRAGHFYLFTHPSSIGDAIRRVRELDDELTGMQAG